MITYVYVRPCTIEVIITISTCLWFDSKLHKVQYINNVSKKS